LKKFDSSGIKKYLDGYKKNVGLGCESAELYTAMGICHLTRKVYPHAINYFEKAIALLPEDGDTYYYAAVALLEGKKAFLTNRPVIDKIETYLANALGLDDKPEYYALYAYIKYDYFFRKSFNTSPTYRELLVEAINHGFNRFESDALYETLSVACPGPLVVR
jgi:tetratricopeptide (TPR) repeat protein